MKRVFLALLLVAATLAVVLAVSLPVLAIAHSGGRVESATAVAFSPQQVLSISKVASPDPVVEGSNLDYDVTVRNSGNVDLTDVVVTDNIPSGTRFNSCSPSPCSLNEWTVTWSGLTVPANGEVTVSFQVHVYWGGTVVLNNSYAASATGIDPVYGAPVETQIKPMSYPPPLPSATPYPSVGPIPTGAPEPTATPIPPRTPGSGVGHPPAGPSATPRPTAAYAGAHLTLQHAIVPDIANPNQEIVLRTTLLNDGDVLAQRVVLDVQIPAGLQAGDPVVQPEAAISWNGDTLWVAWGDLPAGSTASLQLRAAVRPDASGELPSMARVQEYGLESQAMLRIPPQVLPSTGVTPQWDWVWPVLAGVLVVGGLMLQWRRRKR